MISDPNRTISETHPGTTERPISSADDDKLERGPFVRRVASALVDRKTGKSRGVVVGVTGPWGSGKSSYKRQLAGLYLARITAFLIPPFTLRVSNRRLKAKARRKA